MASDYLSVDVRIEYCTAAADSVETMMELT